MNVSVWPLRHRRFVALLALASTALLACGGSGKPTAHPPASIAATKRAGAQPTSPPPASPSTSPAGNQAWTGTAHLSYAVPLRQPCKGTADFVLDLVVGANGTISGTGTGGYSAYTCHTYPSYVTEPGASAHYTVTGSTAEGHLVFFMAPDPPGRGLPPAWPSAPIGSFDVPITGKEAAVEIQSSRSGGSIRGHVTLTVSLACTTCP